MLILLFLTLQAVRSLEMTNALNSVCPSFACISDYETPLPQGSCAKVAINPFGTSVRDYKFSEGQCPAGQMCPFELLIPNATYTPQTLAVSCTQETQNYTSMQYIIKLAFNISYSQALPGENCTSNDDCFSG